MAKKKDFLGIVKKAMTIAGKANQALDLLTENDIIPKGSKAGKLVNEKNKIIRELTMEEEQGE